MEKDRPKAWLATKRRRGQVYSGAVAEQASRNPEPRKVDEFGAFDLLRFALAATVALSHIGLIGWEQSGNLSVQVFFALSGWLIGSILYRTKPSELCRFYYNRSTRIWIPYFACVAVLYLVSAVHEPVRSSRWWEFLGYDLTFTHNWFSFTPDFNTAISQMPLNGTGNHFWSLAVEEQFYLVAPLIITLLPLGRSWVLWIVISAICCLTASEYGAISLGVLSAMVSGESPGWHRTFAWRAASLVLLASSAGLIIVYPNLYPLLAPIFAVSAVLLCAEPIRRTEVTRWLGGVSFPFYLNAWIGVFVAHAVQKHYGLQETEWFKVFEFLSSLAAAALAYRLVDQVVMRRRDAVYRREIGWTFGATGYVLILCGTLLWIVRWHHS